MHGYGDCCTFQIEMLAGEVILLSTEGDSVCFTGASSGGPQWLFKLRGNRRLLHQQKHPSSSYVESNPGHDKLLLLIVRRYTTLAPYAGRASDSLRTVTGSQGGTNQNPSTLNNLTWPMHSMDRRHTTYLRRASSSMKVTSIHDKQKPIASRLGYAIASAREMNQSCTTEVLIPLSLYSPKYDIGEGRFAECPSPMRYKPRGKLDLGILVPDILGMQLFPIMKMNWNHSDAEEEVLSTTAVISMYAFWIHGIALPLAHHILASHDLAIIPHLDVHVVRISKEGDAWWKTHARSRKGNVVSVCAVMTPGNPGASELDIHEPCAHSLSSAWRVLASLAYHAQYEWLWRRIDSSDAEELILVIYRGPHVLDEGLGRQFTSKHELAYPSLYPVPRYQIHICGTASCCLWQDHSCHTAPMQFCDPGL